MAVSDDEEYRVERKSKVTEEISIEEQERRWKAYKEQKVRFIVEASRAYSRILSETIDVSGEAQFTQPKLIENVTLRGYQLHGVHWLSTLYENGFNAILADEMGLGKTLQTIAFLAYLQERGACGPHLIVCPLSVLDNWCREFERFAPSIPILKYYGTVAERTDLRDEVEEAMRGARQGKQGKNSKNGASAGRKGKGKSAETPASPPVILTTYSIITRDAAFLATLPFRVIVVDEAHRLKNLNCKLINELRTFQSTNRVLLTGTPLQNSLVELFSLLSYLCPDIFDDIDVFTEQFDFSEILMEGEEGTKGEDTSTPQEMVKDEEKSTKHEETLSGDPSTKLSVEREKHERMAEFAKQLHRILTPFMLRRLKKEVEGQLPQKKEYILTIPMTVQQRMLYDRVLDKTLRVYRGEGTKGIMSESAGNETARLDAGDIGQARDIRNITNGHGADSDLTNGHGTNGGHANGHGINDDHANDYGTNGKSTIVKASNGSKANGKDDYGKGTNGKTSIRKSVNGKAANGKAATGKGVNGRGASVNQLSDDSDIEIIEPSKEESELEINQNAPETIRSATKTEKKKPAADRSTRSSQNGKKVLIQTTLRMGVTSTSESSPPPIDAPLPPRKRARKSYKLYDSESEDESESEFLEKLAPFVTTDDGQQHIKSTAKRITQHVSLNNVLMQLRKVANHPYLIDWPRDAAGDELISADLLEMSGKMRLLDRLLTQLFATGHKVLVFSQFTSMLDAIHAYANQIRGWGVYRIDGRVKLDERQEQIDAFNGVGKETAAGRGTDSDSDEETSSTPDGTSPTPDDIKLFLLSTRSGGVGITLTAADTVIFFDSDWNPQMDRQAIDRVHRIGQTKNVLVFRLVSGASIEEDMLRRARAKLRLEDLVIGQGHYKGEYSNVTQEASHASILGRLAEMQSGEKVALGAADTVLSDEKLAWLLNRDFTEESEGDKHVAQATKMEVYTGA